MAHRLANRRRGKGDIALDYSTRDKVKVIEHYMTFPRRWTDKDTRRIYDNDPGWEAFKNWHIQALQSEDYEAAVNSKYED